MVQANADRKLPLITILLVVALAAVFCAELLLDFDARSPGSGPQTPVLQPSVRTLDALGGSSWNRVVDGGEWFRLISAPFLHAGPLHLAVNGVILLLGGMLAERMLGRAWFAAIYTVSGITGVMMSLTLNPASVVSVGASGAIMGLMACLFVTSFHFPAGPTRSRLRVGALQVLIPSLVPVATSLTGRVDVGAHLGGALGGAAMALVMLACWPRSETLPRLRWLVAAVACAGLVATVMTVGKVQGSYLRTQHEIALLATLIPNSQLPRTDEEWKSRADVLALSYSHDPRLRLFRGATKLDKGDWTGAEQELRVGLADMESAKELLPARLEALLRTNLAIALSHGKKTEARAVAEPVCRLDSADMRPARMRLKSLGLCD
jgi:rhomboid protease GluP